MHVCVQTKEIWAQGGTETQRGMGRYKETNNQRPRHTPRHNHGSTTKGGITKAKTWSGAHPQPHPHGHTAARVTHATPTDTTRRAHSCRHRRASALLPVRCAPSATLCTPTLHLPLFSPSSHHPSASLVAPSAISASICQHKPFLLRNSCVLGLKQKPKRGCHFWRAQSFSLINWHEHRYESRSIRGIAAPRRPRTTEQLNSDTNRWRRGESASYTA